MPRRSARQDTEIVARRLRVGEMYLTGSSQRTIAAELGVTQPTISTDLKALREVWLEQAVADFDEVKGRELARIDAVEREYWAAWRRSCNPKKKQATRQKAAVAGGAAQPVEARVESSDQNGDPRFLDGVRWCIEQRLKIFGVYDETRAQRDYVEWLAKKGYSADLLADQFVSFMGATGNHGGGDQANGGEAQNGSPDSG